MHLIDLIGVLVNISALIIFLLVGMVGGLLQKHSGYYNCALAIAGIASVFTYFSIQERGFTLWWSLDIGFSISTGIGVLSWLMSHACYRRGERLRRRILKNLKESEQSSIADNFSNQGLIDKLTSRHACKEPLTEIEFVRLTQLIPTIHLLSALPNRDIDPNQFSRQGIASFVKIMEQVMEKLRTVQAQLNEKATQLTSEEIGPKDQQIDRLTELDVTGEAESGSSSELP